LGINQARRRNPGRKTGVLLPWSTLFEEQRASVAMQICTLPQLEDEVSLSDRNERRGWTMKQDAENDDWRDDDPDLLENSGLSKLFVTRLREPGVSNCILKAIRAEQARRASSVELTWNPLVLPAMITVPP
jgi:hypothetical protein